MSDYLLMCTMLLLTHIQSHLYIIMLMLMKNGDFITYLLMLIRRTILSVT